MNLFKYCSPQTGRIILEKQTLRFSPVSAFNDPFDSLAGTGILDTPEFRQQLIDGRGTMAGKDLASAIAENRPRLFQAIRRRRAEFRILCLSLVPPDHEKALLLWGHYTGNDGETAAEDKSAHSDCVLGDQPGGEQRRTGDKDISAHAGFVLEFDGAHAWFRNQPFARAVAYPESLERHSATFDPSSMDFRITEECVFTKSHCWKYEGEYRLLRARNEQDLDSSSCDSLLKFPSELLVSITFGLNTPTETQEEIRGICSKKYQGAQFRKVTEIDPSKFRLIIEDLDP